jgi:hypothetical protein
MKNLAYNAPLSDSKVLFLSPMEMFRRIELLALGLCDSRRIWICLYLHDTVAGARSLPVGGPGTIAAHQTV